MGRPPVLQMKHVKWLQLNYNKFPDNQALASMLNKMVKEDNAKEICILKDKMANSTCSSERIALQSRIRSLQNVTITRRHVQNVAYKYRIRKNAKSIAATNAKNAKKSREEALKSKAQDIQNNTLWIRYTRAGEIKVGKLQSPDKYNTFQATLSRWNKEEGQPQGLFISSEIIDKELGIIKIEANRIR